MSDIAFTALITNAGRYGEGRICDCELSFPTTREQVRDCLRSIGVDGIRYKEIMVTQYDSDIDGLAQHLPEWPSIDELNYLAVKLLELGENDLEKFSAALQRGDYRTLPDLINLTENLDHFILYNGVDSQKALGEMLAEEDRESFSSMVAAMKKSYDRAMVSLACYVERLEQYQDHESYGRDCDYNSNGIFADGFGFLDWDNCNDEVYSPGEVPEEYQVFAFPAQRKKARHYER